MSKIYSKEEVKKMVEAASENMATFYTRSFINYQGQTKDDRSLFYCEYISRLILSNYVEWFARINPVNRRHGYFRDSHTAEKRFSESNREEEKIAMFYYSNQSKRDAIGRIIDYQTPLKGRESDSVGKVDLLSFDKDENVLFLELKRPESKETLLRCIVEAYSYTKFVNRETFKRDFKNKEGRDFKEIIPCAIFFENSRPYEDYKRIIEGKFPYLKQLIEVLGVKLYCIRELEQKGNERLFESVALKY